MSYFAAETINNTNGTNELVPCGDNGLTSTLTVCMDHIENAIVTMGSLTRTIDNLTDNYIEIGENAFVHRASLVRCALEGTAHSLCSILPPTETQLDIAKALATGALAICEANGSGSDIYAITPISACIRGIENAVASVSSVACCIDEFSEKYIEIDECNFIANATLMRHAFGTVFYSVRDILTSAESQLEIAKKLADLVVSASQEYFAADNGVGKEAV